MVGQPRIGAAAAPRPSSSRRKRFGQHFLADSAVVDAILAAMSIAPADRVLEIGPGAGALTAPLSQRCRCLTAVEIDRNLARRLQRQLPAANVVQGDALTLDYAALCDGQPMRIVGNLPYNISTPLLNAGFDACAMGLPVQDMHFMLQTEVAQRLAARPGTRAWGRLSVIAQYHCEAAMLFDVPATAFSPPPQVSSTFVRLMPRPPKTPVRDVEALRRVLRAAFGQRRKRLGNAVKSLRLNLAALGLNADARPETLAVEDFVAMANQEPRRG